MVDKLVERLKHQASAIKGEEPVEADVISDTALFSQMGNKLKVIKRGD